MTKVMNSRHAPSIGPDMRGAQERPDRVGKSCAGVGGATPSVVPKEWTLRRDGDLTGVAGVKILIDLANTVGRERHEPRLVKLRLAKHPGSGGKCPDRGGSRSIEGCPHGAGSRRLCRLRDIRPE